MREELLPRFIEIPAGEFTMGSTDGDDDERPVRRVRVDHFSIATHPVTNAQYAEFVRNTGHRAPDVRDLPSFVAPTAEDLEALWGTWARYYVGGSSAPLGRVNAWIARAHAFGTGPLPAARPSGTRPVSENGRTA